MVSLEAPHLAVQLGSLESTAGESQPCSQGRGEIISPSKEHCNLRSKGSPSCRALYRLKASPRNTHSRPLQDAARAPSKVPPSPEFDWPSKPLSPKTRTSLLWPAHRSARHRPAAILLAHSGLSAVTLDPRDKAIYLSVPRFLQGGLGAGKVGRWGAVAWGQTHEGPVGAKEEWGGGVVQ